MLDKEHIELLYNKYEEIIVVKMSSNEFFSKLINNNLLFNISWTRHCGISKYLFDISDIGMSQKYHHTTLEFDKLLIELNVTNEMIERFMLEDV